MSTATLRIPEAKRDLLKIIVSVERREMKDIIGELIDEYVGRHRETIRAGRTPMLSASLVGYTNAGKSSVLRGLSGQHEIVVEDRLFATLDTLTRDVDLGEGYRARVTDTVGFIRKLPHHLVASFRATLEEARSADVLLHVVDASHPGWEEQMDVVEQVLLELGLQDRPVLPVFNKIDRLSGRHQARRRSPGVQEHDAEPGHRHAPQRDRS